MVVKGPEVRSVKRDSPADLGGLQEGDLIVMINGRVSWRGGVGSVSALHGPLQIGCVPLPARGRGADDAHAAAAI